MTKSVYKWDKEFLGRYYKNEKAILVCKNRKAEGYYTTDRNSERIATSRTGQELEYSAIYLDNGFVWVKTIINNYVVFVPIRRWNGVRPDSPSYELSQFFKGFELKELKENSSSIIKRKEKGWDIYIDNHKNIMFISPNEKITEKSISKIKKSFSDITDYKVVVIENIKDINYL